MHRKYLVALGGAILALGAVPSAVAQPGGSPTVTVRVEGRTHTLFSPKSVTTPTGWITQGGAPSGACAATSAAGALDVAANHNWSGSYSQTLHDYFLTKILGDSETGKKYFWAIFVNNVSATTGACGIQLHDGDRLMFAVASTKTRHPTFPTALRGAPPGVGVTQRFRVQVVYFNGSGKARPLAGVHVTGTGVQKVNAVTNRRGFAWITAGNNQGPLILHASPAGGYVRAVPVVVQVQAVY